MSYKPLLQRQSRRLSAGILLGLIVVGEMARVFLGNGSGLKTQQFSRLNLFVLFLSLQVVFAPLQAGLSDFYCRKRSIIFCLICITMSIFISSLYTYRKDLLILSAVLFGIAGNLIPISRAGLLDLIFPHHNFRFFIGLSTVAIAAGYCLSAIFFRVFSPYFILVLILIGLVVGSAVAYFYFIDIKDTDSLTAKMEFSLSQEVYALWNDFLKKPIFLLPLLTYFFIEVAFYEMFFDYTTTSPESFLYSVILMCLGYMVGAFILRTSTKNDEAWIRIGLFCSFLSLVLFTCTPTDTTLYLRLIFFILFSMGYGLFIPCLFSLLSKHEPAYNQGKIYGLVDSFDAAALLIAYLMNGELTKSVVHSKGIIHYHNFIIPILSIPCFFIAVLIYKYYLKYKTKI